MRRRNQCGPRRVLAARIPGPPITKGESRNCPVCRRRTAGGRSSSSRSGHRSAPRWDPEQIGKYLRGENAHCRRAGESSRSVTPKPGQSNCSLNPGGIYGNRRRPGLRVRCQAAEHTLLWYQATPAPPVPLDRRPTANRINVKILRTHSQLAEHQGLSAPPRPGLTPTALAHRLNAAVERSPCSPPGSPARAPESRRGGDHQLSAIHVPD
jgi:hypothetical protein